MNANKELECIDHSTGNLIAQYELGLLDTEDRDRFEDHLMDCEFCRSEIEQMMPIAHILKRHKFEIKNSLQAEVVPLRDLLTPDTTDKIKGASLSKQGDTKMTESIARFFRNLVENITKLRVYAPALAVVSTVIFCTVIFIKDFSGNPYIELLTFEPLHYRQMTLRGKIDNKSELLFFDGMMAYSDSNYKLAIDKLEAAVTQSPDSWKYWMYLGVSHYLERNPEQAVNALLKRIFPQNFI